MGHTHKCQLAFKKKNQVKSPSPESRVPETGSDPPIGSGLDSGRDTISSKCCYLLFVPPNMKIYTEMVVKLFMRKLSFCYENHF